MLEEDKGIISKEKKPVEDLEDEISALRPRVLKFFRSKMNGKYIQGLDPDDLTQDVIIKAISKKGQFKNNSSLFTWVISIARRLLLDRKYRAPKVSRNVFQLNDGSEGEGSEGEGSEGDEESIYAPNTIYYPTVVEDLIKEQRRDLLRRAINDITDVQTKQILEMYYFRGMSQKEIANKFNMLEDTIKARIHRFTARLK